MIDENSLINKLNIVKNGFINKDNLDSVKLAYVIEKIIELLKSEPKVGEWIPVEERLPEEAGVYRVTCLYADKIYRIKDDLFYSDRTWGYDNRTRKVIAWKPLEKPYRVPLEKNSKGETE